VAHHLDVGERFGKLRVVAFQGRNKHGRYMWECRCDCGGAAVVQGTALVNGVTKSCGCLKRAGNRRTHGKAGTRAHWAWKAMKQRCTNRDLAGWKNYGGRGITFDPRWESFENFLADMGEPPRGGMLDRIDNDGPYTKDNCRWATRTEQNRNRRTTIVVEHNGARRTLQEWAEVIDVPYDRLLTRYLRGWAPADILRPGRLHRFHGRATDPEG
jgi:hypothetical protein